MANARGKGSPLKGLNLNLIKSMHKRKYSELILEEKTVRKRKRNESNSIFLKKSRKYPGFELLAARIKGYLARVKYIRMIYTFYS
jgi:hypothetical protein